MITQFKQNRLKKKAFIALLADIKFSIFHFSFSMSRFFFFLHFVFGRVRVYRQRLIHMHCASLATHALGSKRSMGQYTLPPCISFYLSLSPWVSACAPACVSVSVCANTCLFGAGTIFTLISKMGRRASATMPCTFISWLWTSSAW